jgi:hypothetical protein
MQNVCLNFKKNRFQVVFINLFQLLLTCYMEASQAAGDNSKNVADQICTEGLVDKDKLSRELIKLYPVSALAIKPSNSSIYSSLSPQRQLFANSHVCDVDCSDSDKFNISAGTYRIRDLLKGHDLTKFVPTVANVDANDYMLGSNSENAIMCVPDQPMVLTDEKKDTNSPSKILSAVRIRGSAKSLSSDRSEPQFATADKASFDLLQDSAGGKRTSNLLAYLGYVLPHSWSSFGDNSKIIDSAIIPYVGINRDVVTVSKGSSAKPSANDTADFGALAQITIFSGSGVSIMEHQFSFRPDYLFDFQDHSKLLSFNFSYSPIVQGLSNTTAPIPINGKSGYFAYAPLFTLKTNAGYYTNRGDLTASPYNKDFLRMGGEVGLGLISQISWLPMDATVTYTRMYPVNGGIRVGELNCVLSYNFNKFTGLSLKYEHGNREDTAKFEKLWELVLSGKW